MSKQFADVCWCHPHFAHPRGSGCSCSMRRNSSNDICLVDSGELTEQRDRRIVQERFAHLLVPILEEIARRFVRFSVLQHLLVWWPHAFPYFDGIGDIRGDRDVKLALHFVRWDTYVTKLCGRLNWLAMLVAHLWCPFPAHAPDTQTPNLVRSSSGRDPDEASSSIIRKWKVKCASSV